MRIARTARFKKAWGELSEEEKKLARKAIENLAIDMGYQSLRVKKIRGTEGIWEARASRSLRLTFEVHGDALILRNVGHHDEALGRP